MTMNTENHEIREKQSLLRILLLAFAIMLLLTVIILRLWTVQILAGREFNERASKQYARDIRIPALRGRIFSSDGKVLAENQPSYEAVLHLSEMELVPHLGKSARIIHSELKRIEKVLGRQSGIEEKNIVRHMTRYPGIPMIIFKNLSTVELAKLAEINPHVNGLELTAEGMRSYPFGSMASHIIGYTGPQDPNTAEDRGEYFYYLPDNAGRSGLEKVYDEKLRGEPGKKLVIVNHRGFVFEEVGDPIPAKPAFDLKTTLDTRLQKTAENLLGNREGAVILMDAHDGAVLAMASAPRYDLNDFVPRISAQNYRKLLKQPGHPFINKAIQSAFMPGSIIKPLIGAAMLENHFPADEVVECDGGTPMGGSSRIKCWAWRSGGHGPLSILEALEVSCNDFFIEGGMKIGINGISPLLASAGIGEKTGIGLPESAGLLPERKPGRRWSKYDTALISIGQGRILVSPIQAACYTAALANGGSLPLPRLVSELYNPVTGEKVVFPSKIRKRLLISPENLNVVRRGMYNAVNLSTGGAKNARVPGLEIYGKTGTAEVGYGANRYKNTWFVGFTKTPKGRLLSVAVLVLRGEAGNKTAAPIAAGMFAKALESGF
ncbi:MAG: penicillin-binding protein 2 [Lentisphaeria bacterium]|nr:penicillin-binding protein 2 [Lentisphaeria bacterium]MBO7328452.1 penicillin-binding protein 2 [Lentisphaeria bacterium]